MVQILKADPYRSFSSGLAHDLSTGLSQGLQQLAAEKTQQYANRALSSRLQGLDLPPQVADYLAGLPPKEQLQALEMFAQGAPQQQGMMQQPMQGQESAQPMMQAQPATQKQPLYKGFAAKSPNNLLTDASGKKTYDEFLKVATQAKNENATLKQMRQLINTGQIHYPWMVSAREKLGIPLNAPTASLRKLSIGLGRSAKQWFGSRMTQKEFETYMQSIPGLYDTDAGKLALIDLKEAENNAAEAKIGAMEQIIRELGHVPQNIERLGEQRAAPQIDAAKDQAMNTLLKYGKPATEYKSKFEVGSSFDDLPKASEHSGVEIQDEKTGDILVSDGKSWKKKRPTRNISVSAGFKPREVV